MKWLSETIYYALSPLPCKHSTISNALEGLSQFRADYAVIGCSGIDADGSVLDFDFEEVRAAQAIIANAKTVFLVADHSKFSRRPMVRVGALAQIHTLFTDRAPPPEIAAL